MTFIQFFKLQKSKKQTRFLPATALCALLALSTLPACTATVAKHGNAVEDYQTTQIVPGIHTRTDVLKIMGSPTTRAPFDNNLWYYIGQTTEKHGIFDPEIIDEKIVAVQFDDEGIVLSLQDMESSRMNIPIEREKTKTQGQKTTIAGQLLGNLGRFNSNGSANQ